MSENLETKQNPKVEYDKLDEDDDFEEFSSEGYLNLFIIICLRII